MYWYDASPRKRYVIDIRQKEKVERMIGMVSTNPSSFPQTKITLVDVYGIFEEEVPDTRKDAEALSVLSFLPKERKAYYSAKGAVSF